MKPRRQLGTYFLGRIRTSVRKKLGLGHSLSELDPYLVSQELVFQAPPLTPELVAAIKRISPQFRLSADESSRRFWELNQNGLCWGEYEALAPVLEALPTPSKVLDVGPGMGRSAVFFKKKLGWQQAMFHLYESTGLDTRYTKAGPRFDDSFCGDLEVLETVLGYNEAQAYEIFDAAQLEARLDRLDGPYDFIYSFFAVGFHWSLEHFLDEVLGLMHDESVGAFTLHNRFTHFAGIEGRVPFRVVDFKGSWPRERWSRLLVMSKNEEALRRL